MQGLPIYDPTPFGIIDSLKLSKTDVDFKSGQKIFFTAQFTKVVNWKIEITQNNPSNGTSCIISGRSSSINASNSVWDGTTTTLPLFTTGQVTVKLSVTDQTAVMTKSFNITSTKTLGTLVGDFNRTGLDPLWIPRYNQSGTTFNLYQTYRYIGGNNSKLISVNSPFNDNFLVIAGNVTWDWMIAYTEIPASAVNTNYYSNLINVGNRVYFNAYVYSDTVKHNKNATLEFQFHEDDNGDGRYTAGTEDNFKYDIKLNWVGWKKISIRYDSIPIVFVPTAGQSKNFGGNNIPQPGNITSVEIMLLEDPTKGAAICGIDEIVLTNDNPFKP